MASRLHNPPSPSPRLPNPASASASSQSMQSRDIDDDDDLDPAAFLQSVRELSAKREREDNERFRKLEEDIEKGRQERLARRADHSRSISPEKYSFTSPPIRSQDPRAPPTTLPSSSTTPSTSQPATPMQSSAPERRSLVGGDDVPDFRGFASAQKPRTPTTPVSTASPAALDSPSRASPSAAMPSRSGTLKWQQRQQSRGGSSRPLSMITAGNSVQAESASEEQSEPSRGQIAAALGARDPSWFRQTADRGIGNAAYRKSQDEVNAGDKAAVERRGLPGMSRETSAKPTHDTSPPPESVTSETHSKSGSLSGHGSWGGRHSTTTTASTSDSGQFVYGRGSTTATATDSDRPPSIGSDTPSLGRTLTMSSSQARLAGASGRPSSPTKGTGGFVQSAMLKRSDSMNKRWTAQPGASLSRQNSVRAAYGGLQGSYSMPKLEPMQHDKDFSNEALARPASSSSNLTDLSKSDHPQASKPTHNHSRAKSITSAYTTNELDTPASLPTSPSKRWSPNKSSWIESALTSKAESRPSSPTKNSQPTWMAHLAKANAQKNSAESTLTVGTPAQCESGAERSTSGSDRKQLRSDSRELVASATKPDVPSTKAKPTSLSPKEIGKKPELEAKSLSGHSASRQKVDTDTVPTATEAPLTTSPATKAVRAEFQAPQPPLATKPKPKPELSPKPQTDFRSTLKSRAPARSKTDEEPEFLARFGTLRKTATEKYVAPDLLKDNILRGKAGLALTGGPQKRERRDELKESLLAKKDQWLKEKEAGIVHERKTSGPPVTPDKPEALAKRELLGRPESVKAPSKVENESPATPEALRRQKSLKEKPTSVAKVAKIEEPIVTKPSDTPVAQPLVQPLETSKLAARFNPGLAGILARGPSPLTNGSTDGGNPSTLSTPLQLQSSSPPKESGPLQDMRKGRAKGPKRRKAGGATADMTVSERQTDKTDHAEGPSAEGPSQFAHQALTSSPLSKPKSSASVMIASMNKSPRVQNVEANHVDKNAEPAKPVSSPKPAVALNTVPQNRGKEDKPMTPVKGFTSTNRSLLTPNANLASPQPKDTPESTGFGRRQGVRPTNSTDEDKENTNDAVPSVKSAASLWGKKNDATATERPSPIQLPNRKDEEAAMRSAGLLASSSARGGLGISVEKRGTSTFTPPSSAGAPPKPMKSSRIVSGHLQDPAQSQGAS